MRRICISCKDLYEPWKSSNLAVHKLNRSHCLECATELATGEIKVGSPVNTNQGTGGGKRILRKTENMS